MLNVRDPAKAHIKRTLRQLYGMTQATAADMKLDASWDRSVDIYPGMVATKLAGENVTLIGAGDLPYGLFGEYIGGDGIDEVAERGVNSVSVWVLGGPDAEFEVDAPAFDHAETWTDPGDGTEVLVHARLANETTPDADEFTGYRGQLCPAGGATSQSADPVARLIKVVSTRRIIIGGLRLT